MKRMEAASSFVLGYTGQRGVRLYVLKVLALLFFAAWVLTWASRSVLVNFILILSAAVATHVYWESNPQTPAAAKKHRNHRHLRFSSDSAPWADPSSLPHFPPAAQANPNAKYRWRDNVRSTVVEHAWETLCGSIVQEFIYDTWYHYLSPDKEFPAEIRRILNHAFGRLSERARKLDLRLVMEDASELLMEQLELYRDTKELVISDAQHNPATAAALRQGDLATRELLLRQRMEVDGNLHPALLHPEGDYKMLTAVSGGLVGMLLDPSDSNRVALRAVAREVLSGCVLRPLMMWCTPYHVNKGLYRLMEEQATKRPVAPVPPMSSQMSSQQQKGEGGEGIAVPALDLAKTRAMQGHWEFEQRIVKNAEAEVTMLQPPLQPYSRPISSHTLMPPPLPKIMRHHARSRSHDGLIQSATEAVAAINGADGGGGFHGSGISIGRGGPPDAQPKRFWSETQQGASSLTKGGDNTKPAATTTTTTVTPEISSDSMISQTSSMSATSPVRHGPHAHGITINSTTLEGHIPPSFPIGTGTSETTVGAAHEGSETTSQMRPSPFEEDSSASFSGALVERAPLLGFKGIGDATIPAGGPVSTLPGTGEQNTGGGEASSIPPLVHGTEECYTRPSPAESLTGFVGLPRARVVAADLNTSGAKDFVVYKIRVGDDSGREWTVSRRYRHFEVLHRQLRDTPYYKSKLPAKRIFIHTQSEDFVEERRNALDMYLQEVLSIPCLARSGDVWEFLRIDSERFEVPGVGHFGADGGTAPGGGGGGGGTLKRGLSRTVLAGASSVGRGVVGAAVDVTRGVTIGVHEVTNAAVDGVGAVLNEARSGIAGLRHRRSASVPEELHDFDPTTANFGFHGPRTMPKKGDPLTRAGTGLLRTATASARKVRRALKSQPSLSQQQQLQLEQQYDVAEFGGVYGEDEGSVHNGAARALHFGGGEGARPLRSESSFGSIRRTSRSSSPTKVPRNATIPRKGSNARPPRGYSPVKSSRRGGASATSASEGCYGVAERAAAFAPGYQPGAIAGRAGYGTETRGVEGTGLSDSSAAGRGGGDGSLGISLYNEIDDFGASSPPISADSYSYGDRGAYFTAADINGVAGVGSTSSSPHEGASAGAGNGGGYYTSNNNNTNNQFLVDSSTNYASQLDLEACTGISAPLYELVDCVFQLQTRGFFRRHVYAVARQVLSMAIGDAIDVYLLAKLSLLRQESTIGRVIQLIQSSLWPGGIWFQRTPQFKALHPEVSQFNFEEELMSPTGRGGPRNGGPGPGMQADKYLTPAGPPPLDEEEVREAVWRLLLKKAPSPLLRLVGRTPYNEGVEDLYEMIQSPTFMKQLGYGLLEIATLHLCPELKGLFNNLDSSQT